MATLTRVLLMVIVAALAALPAGAALVLEAGDKVHLKDGTVLEGTITREEQGYVWIKIKYGTLERERLLTPGEIARVEKAGAAAPAGGDKATPAAPSPAKAEKASPRRSGAPRAAVLSVGDRDNHMVGVYVVAQALKEAVPLLEQEEVDIVVLRISSGGGYTFEVQRLSDAIQNDLKPRFRTVAWIESAISAAAMTAHAIEEIYFMPEGQYGACTEFSGALVATKERPLEERLYQMEKISARGGYDSKIMRAMQIMEPLSATIDDRGEVHWYQDLSGEHVVNPEGRILTFNSQQAAKFKFSKGTASTIEELGKLMGYQELDWVGEQVKGVPYPVSKAEKLQREFRRRSSEAERNIQLYFENYNQAIALAQGAGEQRDRAKFVGIARGWLEKIVNVVRTNHNMGILIAGTVERFNEWVEEQRELLRRLMR